MSPEHDLKPQPSAIEEEMARPSIEASLAVGPPASAEPVGASGAAAAAVARAQEPSETNTEEVPLPVSSSEISPSSESGMANEAVASGGSVGVAEETATTGGEAADAGECTETMDQLLDQFSTPAPAAAEGEIFDGRVLAVTDAGVVVDVGGKFEGLVPAQEFAESGSAIEFGPGQTIEVERLHEHR